MSPEQKTSRLTEIVDCIDGARYLVEAGCMATKDVEGDQGSALSELLREVSDRLTCVVNEMRELRQAA